MFTNNNNNQNSKNGDNNYIRLDQRTKISLMAAIIFGFDGSIDEGAAIEHALSIDRAVGDRLRKERNEKEKKLAQLQEAV